MPDGLTFIPGTRPGVFGTTQDPGTTLVNELLEGIEFAKPPPPISTGRRVLGALGDALLAAAAVRAGRAPEPGPFAQRLAQREATAAEVEAANRALRNRIRIGQFAAEQDALEEQTRQAFERERFEEQKRQFEVREERLQEAQDEENRRNAAKDVAKAIMDQAELGLKQAREAKLRAETTKIEKPGPPTLKPPQVRQRENDRTAAISEYAIIKAGLEIEEAALQGLDFDDFLSGILPGGRPGRGFLGPAEPTVKKLEDKTPIQDPRTGVPNRALPVGVLRERMKALLRIIEEASKALGEDPAPIIEALQARPLKAVEGTELVPSHRRFSPAAGSTEAERRRMNQILPPER